MVFAIHQYESAIGTHVFPLFYRDSFWKEENDPLNVAFTWK